MIGAMTRHIEVSQSAVVKGAIPALAALAGGIGDPQVRNRGTIGGSLANNDPAADYPAAALALGATIVTDKRRIAADAYFTGLFETALEPGEIHHQGQLPDPAEGGLREVSQPRLALRARRRVRRQDRRRRARRGDGRGRERRLPGPAFEAALDANFSASALAGRSFRPRGSTPTSMPTPTIAPT